MHRFFKVDDGARRFAHDDTVRGDRHGPGHDAHGRGHGRNDRHHRGRDREDGHGGRHGRHGGGGRMFDQGELRYVILHLIAERPAHGYELIKAIEERLGGGYSPSPGVIYPTLTWLEELGYASVTPTDGGRRQYAITDTGLAHLAANRAVVEGVLARMDAAGAQRASAHAAPIVRAMENLKLALRLRTSRGALSEAELDVIAAALDGAARTIERS